MTTSESPAKAAPRPARKRRPYRRTEIQQAALLLFHEQGFAETSMEDIGSAVGLAGPSIYRHFASKAEILATAIGDQTVEFWSHLERAASATGSPQQQMQAAVRANVEWYFDHPLIVAVSIQLRGHLAPEDQQVADRENRRLVTSWVDLLLAARPELERPEARLRVRGALDLVLGMALARTSLSRQRAAEITRSAMLAVLLSD